MCTVKIMGVRGERKSAAATVLKNHYKLAYCATQFFKAVQVQLCTCLLACSPTPEVCWKMKTKQGYERMQISV